MPYRLPTVKLKTKQGEIIIRPYLTGGLVKEFSHPTDFEAREFAIRFLREIIQTPDYDLDDLISWSDSTIEYILQTWLKHQTSIKTDLPQEVSLFVGFQSNFQEYMLQRNQEIQQSFLKAYKPVFANIENFQKQMLEYSKAYSQISDSLSASLENIKIITDSILPNLQSNIGKIIEASQITVPKIDIGNFFSSLPDYSAISQGVVERVEAARHIDDNGFPFLMPYWTLADAGEFIGINDIDPRVRSAVITNKLLASTRQDEFRDELKNLFQSSQTLNRRWHLIEQALLAHRNRQYALSIPSLLSQVEGIFTDALVLKGIVIRRKGKFLAKDKSGQPKLNKHGKVIELHGLGRKVQNSNLRNETGLQSLAEFFTSYLVSERNDILHGRIINYDNARLSVQLILIIYVLALEFNYFEQAED